MFTGIVTCTGTLRDVEDIGDERTVRIDAPGIDADRRRAGDSIAVQGVCLTVREAAADGFHADLSAETLRSTTLGGLAPGDPVNLEPALRVGEPLGGHLVTGHVDGVGRVAARHASGRSVQFLIETPAPLVALIAIKGSVCVDGVSLTVNDVDARRFRVDIVPHTLAVTSLERWRPRGRVNLEVDLLARYLARYLEARGDLAAMDR